MIKQIKRNNAIFEIAAKKGLKCPEKTIFHQQLK